MAQLLKAAAYLLLLCVITVQAADLVFSKVTLTLSEDDRVFVDAQLKYQLNETATEALENGVPLTFEMRIQMRDADAWVWEKDIVEYRLRSVLRYRPLSALYEVRDLSGGAKQVFATRISALRYMGRISDLAIVNRDKLDLNKEYLVRLEAYLDVEALPLPMRPKAYLSSDWDIEAEPWEWRLKP